MGRPGGAASSPLRSRVADRYAPPIALEGGMWGPGGACFPMNSRTPSDGRQGSSRSGVFVQKRHGRRQIVRAPGIHPLAAVHGHGLADGFVRKPPVVFP